MRAYEEPGPTSSRPPKVEDESSRSHPEHTRPARRETLTPAALLHLQRTAGNASVVQLLGDEENEPGASPVKDVVGSGSGRPLDEDTREFMESRLGHDFSDVRVHTDGKATESAASVQANAYTVGRDVVFKSDQWSPNTDSGQRMLAHELTHVVQQKAGPVDGTPAPGGIRVSDPSDRFERQADEVADQVMASRAAEPGAMAAPGGLQRQEGEEAEEEELQASAVQRQEGEEAEEEELQMSAVQRQDEEEEELETSE